MMKLKVLVDNNTYIDQYYLGEPAVSYYIESGSIRLLFDTGYSDIFMRNARDFGIELRELTCIVCSHGHNDHTRGLMYLRQSVDLSRTKLIAHPGCFYDKEIDGEDIGAPYSQLQMEEICRFTPVTQPFRLSDTLTCLGEIPALIPFETRRAIGRTKIKGIWKPDYVMDDSALVYRHEDGLFIITGCSHSGICNIIEYAKKVCGEERILGVLGGFHLFDTDERLMRTIEYLKGCNIKYLYPCHCVSLKAKAKMMETLDVEEVGVGMEINL